MITNWKTLAAGGLGLLASAIWLPRMFGSSGPKIDPASEPPAEYWESGATEPWEGQPLESVQGVAVQPVATTSAATEEDPTTAAAELPPSAPVQVSTSPSNAVDPVDPQRLLNLAQALRGGEPAGGATSLTGEEASPGGSPTLSRPNPIPFVSELQESSHLAATMVGEDSTALIDGQLVRVGDFLDGSGAEVVAISSRRVTCRLGEVEFELRMPAFRTRGLGGAEVPFDEFDSTLAP